VTLYFFFISIGTGVEPVREWLRELSKEDKKRIGEDIKTIQYGWPLGMPLVRKLEANLWEVRIRLVNRIARIIFTMCKSSIVLLHGFVKKSQKTPADDLELAKKRMKEIKGGA